MAHVILVVGVGCSGTSATAGILHKLGVKMGRENHMFIHPVTQHPLYEDSQFYGSFKDKSFKSRWVTYERDMQGEKYIGLKNTLIGNHLDWVVPFIQERGHTVKVVISHREFISTITGRMQGKCPPTIEYTHDQAITWGLKAHSLLYKQLNWLVNEQPPITSLHLQFEDLLNHPLKNVRFLAKLFEPEDKPSEETIMEAVLSIKK